MGCSCIADSNGSVALECFVSCKTRKWFAAKLSHVAIFTTFLIFLPLAPSGIVRATPDHPQDNTVRIGVMGLFHPQEFTVSATENHALALTAGGKSIVLEGGSGAQSATVRISKHAITLDAGAGPVCADAVLIAGRKGEPADFNFAIPGKITRRYHGTLEIHPSEGYLVAIIKLDREFAVASVVAAESLPDTPIEALKAQAIAARSYFVAGRGRHQGFDFCDTTHCQFFRDLPQPETRVAQAVAATRNLVLVYNSHPVAAMYTRSCSGRTRTPAELGMNYSAYPYFSVDCKYCRTHPSRWSTRIATADSVDLRSSNESSRLNTVRHLGWDAVPGNTFAVSREGDHILLQGTGQGHGIGLCQSGARAMASEGADYREILSHYYPNTEITQLRD